MWVRWRRVAARAAYAVVLVVAATALAGCAGGGKAAPPPARPTPIGRLNTASMTLPRVEFCNRVPRVAVRAALGTGRWRLAHYRDGDRTAVAGSTDTVSEDGCAWAAERGSALARAWVFAPPVGAAAAHAVSSEARTHPGCHVVQGPAFGRPSLTQVCTVRSGTRVRHAGLFGSTWLSCEVSDASPASAVRARADAWCVQIANTLNTAR